MKKFYNNTIMSGAFSKALRVLALLCVLLGFSGSAWATIYLKGGFNNWEGTNTFSNNTTCKITLAANTTYEFKINNNYVENGSTIDKWYSLNNLTITSTNCSNITLYENNNNSKITTSSAGEYVFTITSWSNSNPIIKVDYPNSGGGDSGGDYDGDCTTTGTYYITGDIVGGWGGTAWNLMERTEDGKGHYYFWAREAGGFKMSNEQNWKDEWWQNNIQVSSECTTITKDGGNNANLTTPNVYIKYNPCTGYIWTEAVQCTGDPVFTVPEVVSVAVKESIDLSKICSSTSDADITYTITSGGSLATLSGSTLTAKQTAGDVTIKASQPLKSPYCSGSTTFIVRIVEHSDVLLAEDAFKNANESWTLSAYLEKTNCKGITEYGFFLCGAETEGGCVPTANSNDFVVKTEGSLLKGQHFTGTVKKNDIVSEWYGYRAYIKNADGYQLSAETKYFTNCSTVYGDTIYVTIDNTLTANNKCELRFKSFDDAWATIKTNKKICTLANVTVGNQTQESITLVKPVVMQVVPNLQETYKGTENVLLTGGDIYDAKAIFFRNINMNGGKELVVRSISKTGTRATLEHIAIRRSKNITLDYISITGSSKEIDKADNALDIDNGEGTGKDSSNPEGLSKSWNCASQGGISKANINIKNCYIESSGFTCIHISAYDGVTFENNEIKALYDFEKQVKGADNTALWGASAKFLNSQNIKFIRNNFTGQHATSVLIQGSQNVLIYNNVFWHENAVKSSANTVAIIRLFSFNGDDENGCAANHPVQNIGIYYNTMFLKNNTVGAGSYHHFDFFRIGSNRDQTVNFTGNYYPATIEFDYNNCYSYDLDVYGKNYSGSNGYTSNENKTKYLQTMSEEDWCGSFKYNNFWSAYEENLKTKPTRSAFTLGSGCKSDEGKNTFTNVQNLVCKTAPEEPGSLVIKGSALNIGAYIQTDESGLLTSDMQMIDRLGNNRPYDLTHTEGKGEYTVGAYQQSEGSKVNKIIWNGLVSSEWDNRNNWYKPNGQLVTCVDILTEDLEVVIPAPNTTKYPVPDGGVVKYPTLPAIAKDVDFSSRTTQWHGEEVNAGKGQIANPTKVANGITMEYGAALIGVEQLAAEGQTVRYTQASTELIVPRKKWILVGPIIRPFDENGKASDMLSGHYYKDQQLPHVWMHEAELSGTSVSWKNPFPDLNVVVPANKVFAIQIPDMYGTNLMFSAERYNKYFGTSYNGEAPIDYTFTGRFTNESALPTYTGLKSGVPALLNNSYPANINVETLIAKKGGTVQTYNYTKKSFEQVKSGLIIAQHGFVYSSDATSLEIPLEAFEVSNTEHRSIAEYMPEVSITVSNQAAEASSTVNLTIDWLKADAINYDTDAPKVFNAQETKLPDLYIMRYNEKWAGVRVPTYDEPIPLGIRVSAADQTFVFSLENAQDMASVMLEDRLEGKTYNLLAGETCTVSGLKVGDCEGRFFLNVGADQYIEDDDVTTDVEDVVTDNNIYIYSKNNNIVVSCSSDVQLQTVIVNDMSGRTATYNVSGQYAEFNLPVVQGVYAVKVVADKATKTGKVILK